MPEKLTCPRGHQWEMSLPAAPATVPPTCCCPVCGEGPVRRPAAVDTGEDRSAASTGWDPMSTLTFQPQTEPAPPDPSLPRIPGYEIQGILGRGGMGVVYKAWQIKLKRIVALKMILAGPHAGPDQLARFRSEAESVAALQHPNIVQIFDVGEAKGCPYCALEFVEGGSLARALSGKPLPAERAAKLAESLARAMHYSHQRGIIHRDLKPANVLLQIADCGLRIADSPSTNHLQSGIPKITDFGLAKHLEGDSGQTRSGAIMGTPSYMAPEQAEGKTREIGPLADVYALGAILYELLTGRPPFRAETPVETMRQVVCDEPVPPSHVQPKVPRDLETICLKCLSKEPARRYRSALMLAQDLERFQAGESILARREGIGRRVWRRVRRSPAAAISLLLLVVALAAAGFFWWRAGASDRLAAARTFEAGLDARDWTPAYFQHMETLLDDLARQAPDETAAARQSLHDAYARAIRESFAARLETEQVPEVEANLDLLEDRDPDLGRQVRQEFRARITRMERFLVLEPPFDNLEAVFAPESVQKRGDPAQRSAPHDLIARGRTDVVLTRIPCRGDVMLEAHFVAPQWLSVGRLGLILNMPPGTARGYTLSMGEPPGKTGEPAPSFKEMRAEPEGQIALRIDRNGVRQREQRFAAAALKDAPLSLRATRKRDLLVFEAIQGGKAVASVRFLDVFPPSETEAGVFGLVWPPSEPATAVRMERLEFSRQLRPADPSPLERGDELYAEGRLAEALSHYKAQENATTRSDIRQEVRCKEGLCLARMGRDDEATALLAPIVAEPGDRWPVVAACQLWVVYLRQERRMDAEGIFEMLQARGVGRERLITVIPEEIRAAILNAHISESGGQNMLYFVDPARVRRFERAADISSLLNDRSVERTWTRLFLVRAYRASGQGGKALDTLAALLKESNPETDAAFRSYVVEEYAWLMRERGEPARGLALVDQHFANWPESYRVLRLARARLLIALGSWEEAENDMEAWFRPAPAGAGYARLSNACLVRGFLRERRGDTAGALEAWKLGLLNPTTNVRAYQEVLHGSPAAAGGGIALMNALLLGSLTNELTDVDAELLQSRLALSIASASPLAAAKEFRLPPSSMRAMSRTARGRDAARKLAYQNLSWSEFCRIPLVGVGVEMLHLGALPGELSAEHETILWQLAEDCAAAVFANKLKNIQIAQLALTWKGHTSFVGWKGLAPTLEPALRAPMAYVLGHRYLRLNQPKEAASFFRTALDDAPKDSTLQRLAPMELERLKGK
jgi:tetratricopeptide (TPR) repeat protein